MRTRRLAPMLLGLGLVFAGALVILVYYYNKAGGRLPTSGERYTFKITVDQPQQLLKHADVRAAGIKVGEVNDLQNKITPDGALAIAEIALDNKKVVPVYRDAQFLVRQKTLVGENYIEIKRGNPKSGELPKDSTLGLKQNQEVVPLDLLLGMVNPGTRKRISKNLQAIGDGFEGRAESFSQALSAVQPLFNDGGKTVALLETQREQVAELIAATGQVTQAVADRGRDAQTLVRAGNRTAKSVARRDAELQEFFGELPATLRQAKSSVSKLSGFAGRATPVVSNLRTGLVSLRQPVEDLRPSARTARTLFNELEPMLKVAEPLVDKLKTFSRTSTPQIPKVDALLRQITPFASFLKPYDREVGSFLANFSSGHHDRTFWGTTARCSCPVNQDSFGNYSAEMKAVVDALIRTGAAKSLIDTGVDPVRKPDELPDLSNEFSENFDSYPRVQPDAD